MVEKDKTQQTGSGVTDTNELQSTRAGSGMTDTNELKDLKSTAGAIAGKVEQTWDDARDRARLFQEDSKQYVRENPTKTVLTALAIGFVLGLITFRR